MSSQINFSNTYVTYKSAVNKVQQMKSIVLSPDENIESFFHF